MRIAHTSLDLLNTEQMRSASAFLGLAESMSEQLEIPPPRALSEEKARPECRLHALPLSQCAHGNRRTGSLGNGSRSIASSRAILGSTSWDMFRFWHNERALDPAARGRA